MGVAGASRCRDERGAVSAIELTMAVPLLVALMVAVLQTAMIGHAHNLLEQSADEGLRATAVHDGSCAAGAAQAQAMAHRIGGDWIGPLRQTCIDGPVVAVQYDAAVLSLVPWWHPTVTVVAKGPKER